MELIFKLTDISNAAQWLLDQTNGRKCMAFHGDMGAGKTTFISAVCTLLGVQTGQSSPTFPIIIDYVTSNGETVYHIDLYRLKSETEAMAAGVEDCLYSGNYCFVEWPEKALGIFPPDVVHVYINTIDPDTRNIKLLL
jgi:tRNA threonylcarbamoyladenosine biosynthesis protein TsaE